MTQEDRKEDAAALRCSITGNPKQTNTVNPTVIIHGTTEVQSVQLRHTRGKQNAETGRIERQQAHNTVNAP